MIWGQFIAALGAFPGLEFKCSRARRNMTALASLRRHFACKLGIYSLIDKTSLLSRWVLIMLKRNIRIYFLLRLKAVVE